MRHSSKLLPVLFLSLSPIGASHAAPYADDLAKCLVQSTTLSDKGELVKWVFAMASLHPEVRATSSLTGEQRTEISRSAAALFTDLITNRCKERAIEAVKYEGPRALESSFGVLGQAAMMELFSNSEVAQGLAELSNYFDKDRFEATFGQAKSD